MFILVTGGSASGKSQYAEDRLLELAREKNNNLIYIATMQPFGEEAHQRIEKHRRQRASKGFDTIECYHNLEKLDIADRTHILLECMSNLVANEMFAEKPDDNILGKIIRGIEHLLESCDNLVIVTNEVFSDTLNYDETTLSYIKLLGEVNQSLAKKADHVVEVVYGIPIIRK